MVNEKNKTALTKDNVEQFSRKIISDRMTRAEFELFKKGYIFSTYYSDCDPEICSIEEKISRKVGETVHLRLGAIMVPHKAKGQRTPREVSVAQLPDKYHLIKPVTTMFEKAVAALPVNKKRLTEKNMTAMGEIRDVIRRHGLGYVCLQHNTGTGEKTWIRRVSDDIIFKGLDILEKQPANVGELSDNLVRSILRCSSECLKVVEHAFVTKKFPKLFLDRKEQELHKQWVESLANNDLFSDESVKLEELEQAMHRQRKRTLRGDVTVEALNNIFGRSLVFHWAGTPSSRNVRKLEFSVSYLTFSMDREEMTLLLPAAGKVLEGEGRAVDKKVRCELRPGYILSGYKRSSFGLPLFDGIRTVFFERLAKHGITPDKFRQMLLDAIRHPFDEQVSKILQKEKDRSSIENSIDSSLVDSSLSRLGKDFPDETQDWFSNAPGGM